MVPTDDDDDESAAEVVGAASSEAELLLEVDSLTTTLLLEKDGALTARAAETAELSSVVDDACCASVDKEDDMVALLLLVVVGSWEGLESLLEGDEIDSSTEVEDEEVVGVADEEDISVVAGIVTVVGTVVGMSDSVTFEISPVSGSRMPVRGRREDTSVLMGGRETQQAHRWCHQRGRRRSSRPQLAPVSR